MTKWLDRAVEAARTLPDEVQDDIARLVPQRAGDEEEAIAPLWPDHLASFDKSFAEAARGEFATDEQIRAIWVKLGL